MVGIYAVLIAKSLTVTKGAMLKTKLEGNPSPSSFSSSFSFLPFLFSHFLSYPSLLLPSLSLSLIFLPSFSSLPSLVLTGACLFLPHFLPFPSSFHLPLPCFLYSKNQSRLCPFHYHLSCFFP